MIRKSVLLFVLTSFLFSSSVFAEPLFKKKNDKGLFKSVKQSHSLAGTKAKVKTGSSKTKVSIKKEDGTEKELKVYTNPRPYEFNTFFGSGWTYVSGGHDTAVTNIDPSNMNLAYMEFLLRFWKPFRGTRFDIGAEAYYWTPTIYTPRCKSCSVVGSSNQLDVSIHMLKGGLLGRANFDGLKLFGDVEYMGFWFDMDSSPSLIIVDHQVHSVSLGVGWDLALAAIVQPLAFIGRFQVGIGFDYNEKGRIIRNLRNNHVTSLHGEAGFRWNFETTKTHLDFMWSTLQHLYDFNLGNAQESYWNLGLRVGWSPTTF